MGKVGQPDSPACEATKANQAMTMQTDNENEPAGTKADQILAKLGSVGTGFTSRHDSLAATLQYVKKECMSHAG